MPSMILSIISCGALSIGKWHSRVISKYVSHVIYEIAERYDFEVIELAVMPEHVHMFVSATPEVSPARLIRIVNIISARQVFKRFPGIKRILGD